MMDSQADLSSGDESNSRKERLDDLVAEYIDRLNSGETLDKQEILSAHPEVAADLLSQLELFVEAGNEGDPAEVLGTVGDYELLQRIGHGGMGVVYRAWQGSMNRHVALKVLPAGFAADSKAVARFVREAQVAGKLSHPNVVSVYGMGVEARTPYYAMEYVEGETLAQILARIEDAEPETETPFGKKGCAGYFEQLARAFADVADGLQHAHSKGVIHRDVKPSNLILDSEDRLRILDFGLARLEGQESLTISGDLVGTPLYMSPEQARRKKIPIDRRTDIYSLGATMYEALCSRPPFRGKDHHDTLSQIIERDPRPPRQFSQRIPADLETIVLKCLRKDPSDRYGTAEALGQDLRRFVRGDPIEARRQSRMEKLGNSLWRVRRTVAVTAMTLLLLASAMLLLVEHSRKDLARKNREYNEAVLSAGRAIQLAKLTLDDTQQWFHRFRGLVFLWTGLIELTEERAQQDIQTALLQLDEASELFPDRPEALHWRARGLDLLGREDEALELLDVVVARSPDYLPAQVYLWSIRSRADRLTAAAEVTPAPETVALGQLETEELWKHAIAAASSLDWRGAARAYELMAEQEHRGPGRFLDLAVEARLEAGVARLRAGEAATAVEHFARAQDRSPAGAIEPALLLARSHYEVGGVGGKERAAEILSSLYRTARDRRHEQRASPNAVAFEIARLYAVLDDGPSALEWIEKVEAAPLHHRLTAAVLIMMKDYDKAIAILDKAVALAGDDHGVHVLRGEAHYGHSEPSKAMEAYEAAHRLNPTDKWVLLKLGWHHLSAKEPGFRQRGVELLNQARQLYPECPLVCYGVGSILVLKCTWIPPRARAQQGLCLFRELLRLDPTLFGAHGFLAICHGWLGNYADALEALEKDLMHVVEPRERLILLVNKAETFRRQDRHEDALACLDEATEWEEVVGDNQLRSSTCQLRAVSLLHLGKTQGALAAYEQALAHSVESSDPSSVPCFYVKEGHFALKQYTEAVPLLEEACQRRGRAEVFLAAGHAYEELDRLEEALEKYALSLTKEAADTAAYRRAYLRIARLLRHDPRRFSETAYGNLVAALGSALAAGRCPSAEASALEELSRALSPDRDAEKLDAVFEILERAAEETGGRAPELLGLLARHHGLRGEHARAVRTLEAALALRLPDESEQTAAYLRWELEAHRNRLGDNLPTYASIDAALAGEASPEVLVPAGASWRYLRGTKEPPQGWMSPDFADAVWEQGPMPIGYGEPYVRTLVDDMKDASATICLRHGFTLDDPKRYHHLWLSVLIDDGFVAFLNGQEVGRWGVASGPDPVRSTAKSTSSVAAPTPRRLVWIEARHLRSGKNVLAIQGLRRSLDSSDLAVEPVLRGAFVPKPPPPEEMLERFRRAGAGEGPGRLHAYLEGRVLQLGGKLSQAVETLGELVTEDPSAPEPALRLAECLGALGRYAEAANVLRRALEQTPHARPQVLWDAWLRISLVNLGRRPEELVKALPSPGGSVEETPADSTLSYSEAVSWLLGTLAQGDPLRINCGGVGYRSLGDVVWQADCFSRGGRRAGTDAQPLFRPFPDTIEGTDDDPLYQTERWFPPFHAKAGYRIPVPPGTYLVTLHFAENVYKTKGSRRFDVLLEGRPVLGLEDYEPPIAKADTHVVETRVDDGVLDVDFVHGAADNPKISAIEVKRGGGSG